MTPGIQKNVSQTVLVLTTILVLLMSSFVFAHRQHLSWSTVKWNQQAKVLEITHRVHAHDASAWLSASSNAEVDITGIEEQAKFALYCADNFKLRTGETWQLLELLGAELNGNYLHVYQQLPLTMPPAEIYYQTTILMDLFNDQEHVVNTLVGSETRSLSFNLQRTSQGIEITEAPE